MKLLNKLKKFFIGIGTFLVTLPSKIYAISVDAIWDVTNRTTTLYGTPQPNLKGVLNIFRLIVIPFALIIGIIIYLKKSKSEKRKKIIIAVLMIVIAVVLFFIIS